MNKKEEDLEAIADLLYEWCVEYGEHYVTASAFNEPDNNSASAGIGMAQSDYWEISIYKQYETPGAATPGESR